jgi:hypothetical protein
LVRNLRENNGDAIAGTPSARFEESVRKAFSNKSASSISPSSIEITTIEWGSRDIRKAGGALNN